MSYDTFQIKIFKAVVYFFRKFFYDTALHRRGVFNQIYRVYVNSIRKNVLDAVVYKNAKFIIPDKDITILPTLITGAYESFEIDVFLKVLKPNYKVFDIGANIGIYTILISKILDKGGVVVSFEPEKENINYLKKNIVLNNCGNINVVEKAVGSNSENVRFYLSDESIGSHSVVGNGRNCIEVPQTTLDEYAKIHDIYPDVLKIDVEGYESHVLKGGKKVLEKAKLIMMEFIPPNVIGEQVSDSEWEQLITSISSNFKHFYLIRRDRVDVIDICKLKSYKYGNLIVSKTEIKF